MAATKILKDKATIERWLRQEPELQLYALGDLDSFFWPDTHWHGSFSGSTLQSIVLLYTGMPMPTLLGLSARFLSEMEVLLQVLLPDLPPRFYAHLSPELAPVLRSGYFLEPQGQHYRMILRDEKFPEAVHLPDARQLGPDDAAALRQLYNHSYPSHWFDQRMLETGHYFGIREAGILVSAGGVHVCSEAYGVAALGNIVTHPQWRGRGLAKAVTAKVCQSLLEKGIALIGLNVAVRNEAAIRCYARLGFEKAAVYEEYAAQRRPAQGRVVDEGVAAGPLTE